MTAVDDRNRPGVVLEGKVAVWTQEGGYASPCVTIGEADLTAEIEDRVRHLGTGSVYESVGPIRGRWRLTFERIDDAD